VVDHPDPFSGAVAHAFVVLDEDAGSPDPAELTAHVSDQVPYYQQTRFLGTQWGHPADQDLRAQDLRLNSFAAAQLVWCLGQPHHYSCRLAPGLPSVTGGEH
jgi:hypothetical protein